ncbi:MAG: methionyl-tRNA formyltransferase [bacterium]|nr:methionyl-tRNA formyltransferase [bacterium]
MKNSRPIVFFGTEDFSAASLEALISKGFEVAAVVTKPDSKKGRGQKLTPPKVKIIAEKHQIRVLQPSKMAEIVPFVESLPIRPIGVLVSFGRIIPQSIIDLFDGGIINVHPSLLPKYRGPSPIESAILNGDDTTGISIMGLTKDMDAGPIYIQSEFPISSQVTAKTLYEMCESKGATLLSQSLEQIMRGDILPSEQNHKQATYCSLLSKNDALLDPSRLTADQAERQIRAFEIFPKSKIEIGENTVIVNSAEVCDISSSSPLEIKFKDGKFLKILTLTAPSGKKISAEEFARGYLR